MRTMQNLRSRATRSAGEELFFLDAVSDQATVISVEQFESVQDDDLSFIDDLSVMSDSSNFQEEQRTRPSTGATAPSPAPGPAPTPFRDLSNSPRTVVTAETNNDFVADDCVDIIGGKYKGETGTVVKRTLKRVRVKLDGADYHAKKSVDLVPHNISHRDRSRRRTGNVNGNDAKLGSPRTVSNDDFVTGDRVDIIGGTYKNKTGTVVKRTPARVQIKLDGADSSIKKPVNLVPHNIRRRDNTRETGSVSDTEPSLPTFTKFLIPSDMPISSEDTDRSVDDSQIVDSAQHGRCQRPANFCSSQPLEQSITTPPPLPPRSEDSMLHSSSGLREDNRRLVLRNGKVLGNGKSEMKSTFALHLFGRRIVNFKVPRNIDTLPSKCLHDCAVDKRRYELLTTKLIQPQTSRSLTVFTPAECPPERFRSYLTTPPISPRASPPTSPPTSPPISPSISPPTSPPTGPPPSSPTSPSTSPPTSPPTSPSTSPPTSPPTGPPPSAPTSPSTSPPTSPPTGPPTSPPTSPLTSPPTSPPTSPLASPPTSPPTSPPSSSRRWSLVPRKMQHLARKGMRRLVNARNGLQDGATTSSRLARYRRRVQKK